MAMGDLARQDDDYGDDPWAAAAYRAQRRYLGRNVAGSQVGPAEGDVLPDVVRTGIAGKLADVAAIGSGAAEAEFGPQYAFTREDARKEFERHPGLARQDPEPPGFASRVGSETVRMGLDPTSWVGPGGAGYKAAFNALSGLGGETAGTMAAGTKFEPAARFAGSFTPAAVERALPALGRIVPEGSIGALGGKMVIPTPKAAKMGDVAAPPDVSLAAPYVTNPQRVYRPGVYKDPRILAREAEAMVEPEHESLKKLFGVTRDDLYEIGQRGARPGNMEPKIWMPKKPGSSYVAESVMTPANAQRLQDAIVEARKYAPELTKGMSSWYVMNPAYQRMEQLYGPERAVTEYNRFNKTMTPFSASSDVVTEINRGTVARMLADQGRLNLMERYGSMPVEKRGRHFPKDLAEMVPHPYSETQLTPVQRYLETGEHGYANDTVKIPLYTQALGVPETGFQTKLLVPDAHLARSVGVPDVRRGKTGIGDYMGGSEYRTFGPWYRKSVTDPIGIEAVPGQGIQWGLYAPQTGVKTGIGAPKIELLSRAIWERALRLGIDPRLLRDQVLRGEQHAELPAEGPGAVG